MSMPPDTSASEPGCSTVRCHATANTSIELFVGLLEQAAEASGGKLSIDQVRALSESFKQAPGKLGDFYAQTHADCSSKTVAQSQPSEELRNPYRQLLMTQVSAGLVRKLPINRDRRSTLFAPHLLKAFAKGLERLMPRSFVTRAGTRAIAIEARLRKSLGDEGFSWEAFCQDPETQELLMETVLQLCTALKAFDQKADLLVTEVNSLLGNVLVSKGVYMPGPPAVFGTQQFRRGIKAMIEESCGDPRGEQEKASGKVAMMDEASRSLIKSLYRRVT